MTKEDTHRNLFQFNFVLQYIANMLLTKTENIFICFVNIFVQLVNISKLHNNKTYNILKQ